MLMSPYPIIFCLILGFRLTPVLEFRDHLRMVLRHNFHQKI